MAYKVFDNGMPADTTAYGAGSKMTKGIGWDICRFDTKLEAYQYAYHWLGKSYAPEFSVEDAVAFNIFAQPRVYSGGGDTIQVREVK